MNRKNIVLSELRGNLSTITFVVVTFAIAFMLAIHQYELQSMKENISKLNNNVRTPPTATRNYSQQLP